jgi:phage-related minor tail protein
MIAGSSRLFGDWSIAAEDTAGTMDYLFRVSQSTGIGVNDLSAKLVQFGAPLRQLGFDLETSAAMLGKFEKEGVNTEWFWEDFVSLLVRWPRRA